MYCYIKFACVLFEEEEKKKKKKNLNAPTAYLIIYDFCTSTIYQTRSERKTKTTCVSCHMRPMCAKTTFRIRLVYSEYSQIIKTMLNMVALKTRVYTRGFHHEKHAYIILTPLKPHFYIVKLGFTGVYIIFLISAQKH